jgi:hypothetical protein
MLTGMTPVPMRFRRTSKRVGLTQTGIPDYANKSLDQQVALFSKLVMENSKRPIYRVWTKLDPVAHSVIMSELGCFDGKIRAQRDEWARKVAAELNRHTHMLRTFLKKQVEHEYRATRSPRFYTPHLYFGTEGTGTLRSVLQTEIKHLMHSRATINLRLKKRGKWDVSGIVRGQEYVIRRVAFLGIPGPVRLTPGAIADIYQLTRRASDGNDDSDTAENIRKAIVYFRKNPENAHFLENIEYYLKDWKEPSKSGNQVPQKKGS